MSFVSKRTLSQDQMSIRVHLLILVILFLCYTCAKRINTTVWLGMINALLWRWAGAYSRLNNSAAAAATLYLAE